MLDLTASPPRILRPGMIHAESLAAVVENIQHPTFNIQHPILKSPGLLQKHYSPKAKMLVLGWVDEADLQTQLSVFNAVKERGPHGTLRPQFSGCFVIAHTHIPSAEKFAQVSVIPHDAEAYARAIYAELHRCDTAGAKLIVVEAPPETPGWAGIADRLRRAAA